MLEIRSRAPLRISFAGGGTDVPPYPEMYGGAVVSTTIDRYAYVTIRENSKKSIRIFSQDFNLLETIDDVSNLKIEGKTSLIKAAIIQTRLNDKNIDILIHSDSAPGSGLGSSSAISVSLIGCLYRLKNKKIDLNEISKSSIQLEREFLKIHGGLQDQYASSFGGFNFIKFNKKVSVNPLKIRPEILYELLASMILIDTGKTRLSGHILEKQIKEYKKQTKKTMENLNMIKKSAYDFKKSIIKGDIPELGEILNSNWENKKQLEKHISNKSIDKIYEKAMKLGVYGGKLLGAGGGGHMLFIVDPNKKYYVINEFEKLGIKTVKFNFDKDGVKTWIINKNQTLV